MSRVNALLDTFTPVDSMGRQRLEIAHDFVDGIDDLSVRLKTSQRRITAAVKASGTSLTEICGLGPITAAIIIGNTGNIDRFPTRHRFASYNGTAPIDASSGPKVRHRLNPPDQPRAAVELPLDLGQFRFAPDHRHSRSGHIRRCRIGPQRWEVALEIGRAHLEQTHPAVWWCARVAYPVGRHGCQLRACRHAGPRPIWRATSAECGVSLRPAVAILVR